MVTEIDSHPVHIEKKDEENRLERNDDEHLDGIREEDENVDDDRKVDEILEGNGNLNEEEEDEVKSNCIDESKAFKEEMKEYTDHKQRSVDIDNHNEHVDEKDVENEEEAEEIEEVKVDDIPLINKSDLIVINVSTSNPLIADSKEFEKRKSCASEMNGEKLPKCEKIETVASAAPISPIEKQSGEVKESKLSPAEKEAEMNFLNKVNCKNNTHKVEMTGDQMSEEKIERNGQQSSKNKHNSIWSKVWTSSTPAENNHETFKSNETSVEIIDSSDTSEKKDGSVETSETIPMEISMGGEIPEARKAEGNGEMIPTHLFFRVKSPYLKYIFSLTIFVLIFIICALLVIFFPITFDLKNLTQHLIGLYNGNESTEKNVPIVETNCGQFKGILNEENIAVFRGIPYAKAPVSERRWLPAEEMNCNQSELIDAFDLKDFCYQKPINGFNLSFSEDCLHLNIWVPNWKKKSNENSNEKSQQPVFIYLAGDMITGYTSMDIQWLPSGTQIVRDYNTIFITLNYRFGILGFLSLDILHKRSNQILNYGLSDIMVALKWINQNIEFFGGDPEQITLLTHGSSATLALAAATNDDSSQYIARVWLSTPSPTFDNITKQKSFESNNQFINSIGCQPNLTLIVKLTDIEEQVLSCILKVSPETLVNATPIEWYQPFNELPSNKIETTKVPILIIDNNLIKSNPYELIDATNVEIIIGMNIEESGAFSKMPIELDDWEDENFMKLIQTQLATINPLITEEVINQYINSSDYLSNEQIYHQLVTEIRYICPLFKSLENLTNKENLYVYLNKYKPSFPIRYTSKHSDSKMTVHGIDILALLDLLTNWFVINPIENDLNYMKIVQDELKSFIHSMNHFNLHNLSKNQINIITKDGELSTSQLPVHNCHRFWSVFNQFAKVN